MAQPAVSLKEVQSHWKTLLNVTRLRHRNLRTLLEDGEPVGVAGREVVIRFKSPSHKNEVEKEFNRQVLEEKLGHLVGQSVQVYCVLPDEWERLKPLVSTGKGHWEIITDLQQEVKGLRDRILQWADLRKDLEKLKRQKTQLHEERADLQQETKNLQDEISRQGTTLTELEFKQEQLEVQVVKMEQRRDELSNLLQSLDVEVQGHRETLVDLSREANNLQDEIHRREATLAELELKQGPLEAQVTQMEQRRDELSSLLQSLDVELQRRKGTLANLEQEVKNLQDKVRRQEAILTKLETGKAELAELDAQLQVLRSQIASKEQQLDGLQIERRQYEEQLTDLKHRIEHARTDLTHLQTQKRELLWQAVLRTDLDAGELTSYADPILDRLEKADPAQAAAFRLEIAARTGRTELPSDAVKELSDLSHLFANVIQARAAEKQGNLTEAVQMLHNGWEAVLSAESTPDQTPPSSSEPVADAPPSTRQPSIVAPTVKTTHSPVYVTGQWSALTLEVNDVRVLVDPGPNYSISDNHPDLVIVTHAHNDHVDQLLPLCERFPGLPVVMTPETGELLGLSLNGWTMIQERQVHCLPVGETRRIEGVDILLHPAGHLLGAAMVDLIMDGARILVTGDFSLRPVGGLPPVKLPQVPYDLVLMEAVHASDRNFPSSKPQSNRSDYLIQRVLRAIEDKYTRILIIAAALGDAQEVYDALLQARKDPQASALADYTICFKGKAHNVAQLYAQAGAWKHAIPAECSDLPAQRTIVIASGGAANPLRQQFSPPQHALVFESHKAAGPGLAPEGEGRYQVDLHASLEELVYLGRHIQCGVIGLYHGHTGGSPLEQQLHSAGKRVINVTTADRMRIELDGDQ